MALQFVLWRNLMFLMALFLCIALVRTATSRPPWLAPGSQIFTESAECHTDDELLDLCQRCAKLTKSKLAYPACCSKDLKARKWCSDYVYFGRGQYDF
ncbi:uncharacterized protein LOC114241151 [Bombyx mandarina]|uniref:Uncharacterized protein n=2 Tax=Bombyx TaxID=7090 RepID=A0A8R2CA83_BOMMO|nr:uncharacterized protein LOC101743815 isoform X1 [Bombyx mori]XP_028027736.1 uncharacterized protein LOC114241151 [Bombyx mandarina]